MQELPSYEQYNVLNTYRQIAESFNGSRPRSWQYITDFHTSIPHGSICLDIGCGGGRDITDNTSIERNLKWYGVDTCPEFVDITRKKLMSVYNLSDSDARNRVHITDMTTLPFTDGMFQAIQLVASFHHLSSIERRKQALREIWRVLAPGGQIHISVWSANRLVNNKSVAELPLGDNIIPWGNNKLPRYYYIFSTDELINLIKTTCLDAEILNINWIHGNIVLRFKKPL